MKIAPSVLSADFANLGKEVEKVSLAGADYIHLDVMDGLFVPNISFGAGVIKSIRPYTSVPFDVHLMIERPRRYIKDFLNAGADIITIHKEAEPELDKTIQEIKFGGAQCGISIKPATDVNDVLKYLPFIDLVLVMTVEPGFGGQSFMADMMSKVKVLRREIDKNAFSTLIEVDGGIDSNTVKIAEKSGADICVAGTSVYKAADVKKAIDTLKLSKK